MAMYADKQMLTPYFSFIFDENVEKDFSGKGGAR